MVDIWQGYGKEIWCDGQTIIIAPNFGDNNEGERKKIKAFLFSTLPAKHLKCKKRSCRKISERLCNICYIEKMKKPDHKILQRSHCPWGILRAYLRMIFTESGITHIMKPIFY